MLVSGFIDNKSNLDKMRDSNHLKDCKSLENHTKILNSMDFGFEKITGPGQLGGGGD